MLNTAINIVTIAVVSCQLNSVFFCVLFNGKPLENGDEITSKLVEIASNCRERYGKVPIITTVVINSETVLEF